LREESRGSRLLGLAPSVPLVMAMSIEPAITGVSVEAPPSV
jgi:hypothetical protein